MSHKQLVIKVIFVPMVVLIFLTVFVISILGGCEGGGVDGPSLFISWDTPSENDDGSRFLPSELSSYVLRWGRNEEDMKKVELSSSVNAYRISDLSKGTYEISITAISVYGTESEPYKVFKTIQ